MTMLYRPPLHGISASEAWAEAATYANVDAVPIDTLSFAHPTIKGGADEIYLVNAYAALSACIEPGAALNAGMYVTFELCAFARRKPKEDAAEPKPTLSIRMVGVSQEVALALAATRGSLDPIVVTLREYLSTDLSSPARLPPLRMYAATIEVTDTTVDIVAQGRDPGNLAYPGKTITLAEYPALST